MKFFLFLLAAPLLSHAADVMDIGTHKQVFWDDHFIEKHEGIRFETHAATRTGEVHLTADKPWEAWMTGIYGTVIRDQGKFRMWYSARTSISGEYFAYAESADGIHWTKPELGVIDFRGSKANNLVTPPTIRPHGGSVWIDPHAPPAERYKFLFGQYPTGGKADPGAPSHAFLTQATSPDGIHVTITNRDILGIRHGEKGVAFDTHNICFWDDSISQYVLYTRKRPSRSIGRAVSADPNKFPLPENVLEPEQWEDADYYSPGVFKYAEADHTYAALVPIFYHPMEKTHPADGQPMLKIEYAGKPLEMPPPDSLDVHLFTSRDGIQWRRQGEGRPVLRLGPEGAFDSRQIYPFTAPVIVGDEIWIYYLGLSVTHMAVLPEKKQGTVSRAVYRLDGLMSATIGAQGGSLTTKPFRFSGDTLELNIDCSAGGHLDLEFLDEQGQPIPGFTIADHDRIYYNAIHHRVTFGGQANLSSLTGRTVRLHLTMRGCDLYALRFFASS